MAVSTVVPLPPTKTPPDATSPAPTTPGTPSWDRTAAIAVHQIGRRQLAVAGAVASATIALGWVFRSSIVPIDPWDYVEGARNFPNGAWNIAGLTRWGMIAPHLILNGMWGNAELTYYAWPLLTSALLGATLFLFGTRVGGPWTGLAAAGLLTSPVIAVHATRGYPDLAATSLVAASLLLLVLVGDRVRGVAANRSDHVRGAAANRTEPVQGVAARSNRGPIGWPEALLLLGAGLLAGWALETRETTLFTFPALLVALLRIGHPIRAGALFAMPVAVCLLADLLASARYYGDALIRLHATSGDLTTSVVAADMKYLGHSRAWYATKPIEVLFARSGGPLLVVLIVVGLIGGAILWRRLWPTWLWGVCAFVPLWWAGGAGDPQHPAIRLDIARYSLSYAIPLALTGVLTVATLVRQRDLRIRVAGILAACGLALGAAIPTIRFTATFPGLATNDGVSLRALREVIATQPDVASATVWSDWATQRLAPVYSRTATGTPLWRAEKFRSLNRLIDRPSWQVPRWPEPGDFVILHSPDDDTCYYCRKAYEQVVKVYALPMPGWQRLFTSRSGNLVVYRIGPQAVWPR